MTSNPLELAKSSGQLCEPRQGSLWISYFLNSICDLR